MRVLVVGDSITLRIRPPRKTSDGGTYAELLSEMPIAREQGWELWNLGLYGCTIDQAFEIVRTWLPRLAPDYVIVNVGINDCAPRILPRRLWYGLNYGVHKDTGNKWFVKKALASLESRIRPPMLRLFPGFSWTSRKRFTVLLQRMLDFSWKESKSKVIVLTIPEPNSRIRSKLPGIAQKVTNYNRILESVSAERGFSTLVDVNRILAEDRDAFVPDGIHFSQAGHKLMASHIAEIMQSMELEEGTVSHE